MYDFKQLSPADFEELTCDLLQKEWGLPLESFKSGRDNGIDLRYAKVKSRPIIIQCKRYIDSNFTKLLNDLRKNELPKIRKLKPKRYVLVTTLPLSPANKEKIRIALKPYIKGTGDIFGATEVNSLLRNHKEIEDTHYKLWLSSTVVLERVLHNASHVQTDYDVERVRRLIPLYVQNDSYRRAIQILRKQNFIIISGVPGIGKTTLADMLLFAHLEAGFQPVVVQSAISEAKDLHKKMRKQIFYFDDFLGQTFLGNRFETFLGRKEDGAILDFIEMVAKSKQSRLILTSREHILQSAFQISEKFKRKEFDLSMNHFVLEIKDYSLLDRARILYNHIFFSDLPENYKAALLEDQFYLDILKHRNFNPRLVEWLSKISNVRSIPASKYRLEVTRVLDNPEQLWQIAFEQQISEASRSILLALYALSGSASLERLEPRWRQLHNYRAKKYNWRTSAEDWKRSLRELEGGFLVYDQATATFVNPSVRDFFDSVMNTHVEHFEDLLATSSSFEEVRNLWALMMSDKGGTALGFVSRSPTKFLAMVRRGLRNPVLRRIVFPSGGYGERQIDTKPDARVATLVSVAVRLESRPVLDMLDEYVGELVEHWRSHQPDFDVATDILRALDAASCLGSRREKIKNQIKRAMILGVTLGAYSFEFDTIVQYARLSNASWTVSDRKLLTKGFREYLRETFRDELRGNGDANQLSSLAATIHQIGRFCEVDVTDYEDLVNEKIAEIEDEDDNKLRSPHEGKITASEGNEEEQEKEIHRLFDGLVIK